MERKSDKTDVDNMARQNKEVSREKLQIDIYN